MAEEFFKQLIVILSFSLLAVIVFQRLRMATIIAYMAVGIVIGPHALNLIPEPDHFSLIAEIGVVFLLFALGLEFSLPKMMSLKFGVFGVGGLQVLSCFTVFAAAVYLWGSTVGASIMIAGALALSSTAIVTRELDNLHQIHSQHGQLSVGVLLFQDLVAVVFLILVPVIANGDEGSLIHGIGSAFVRGALLFGLLMVFGKWVLPFIFKEVARSKSEEIFVLTTLVFVLLAAWITHSFELSMALGGFVTGMMLGESPFKLQIENDIRPFKDILLGLFFVYIGMNLDIELLFEYWPRIILFTLLLILIKASVVTLVLRFLGYRVEDAIKVGVTLAQAGEFGLALMSLAYINGIVPLDQSSFTIIIAIFTMALSPFLIRNAKSFSDKVASLSKKSMDAGKPENFKYLETDHVIIGGFGRVGTTIAELLTENNIPYVAIDNNIDQVNEGHKLGRNIVYGDCHNIDMLLRCHIKEARLAILTFRSIEQARAAIIRIRQKSIDVPIIVRCSENANLEELISLGANHVFAEMLESSLLISSQVLALLEIDDQLIEQQINELKKQFTH